MTDWRAVQPFGGLSEHLLELRIVPAPLRVIGRGRIEVLNRTVLERRLGRMYRR